jgi:hypothetical protein
MMRTRMSNEETTTNEIFTPKLRALKDLFAFNCACALEISDHINQAR